MRSASPALLALLNSGEDFEQADIWRIVLSGGHVLRWTDADVEVVSDGQTYAVGPVLSRGRVSDRTGLETSTLELEIDCGDDDTVNGVPLLQFISRRGLDGATVQLRRAFLRRWGEPVVGDILRFAGRVTSVGNIQGDHAAVTISSWTILLNVNFPPDLYQVPCLNTVYDPQCGLDPDDWRQTGSVVSGPIVSSHWDTFPGDWMLNGVAISEGNTLVASGGQYRLLYRPRQTASRIRARVRQGSARWVVLFADNPGFMGAWFDLQTGTIGVDETGMAEMVGDGDDWYVCSIPLPSSGSGNMGLGIVDQNGSISATDGSSVFVSDIDLLSSQVAPLPTVRSFVSTLSLEEGWLSQGTLTFTSGPNAGISRSVRGSAGDGTVTLVQPLPVAPEPGDTFEALPGCDLTRGTCSAKFNNLLRHRGFPFVPTPETAI